MTIPIRRGLAVKCGRLCKKEFRKVSSKENDVNAINKLDLPKPWKISFSYGRALQDPAIEAWHGKQENLKTGQQAFYLRAKCNSAAALGTYTSDLEGKKSGAKAAADRSDWHDD